MTVTPTELARQGDIDEIMEAVIQEVDGMAGDPRTRDHAEGLTPRAESALRDRIETVLARYFTYDRGEFNRDEMQERAPAAPSSAGWRGLKAGTIWDDEISTPSGPSGPPGNEVAPMSTPQDVAQALELEGLHARLLAHLNVVHGAISAASFLAGCQDDRSRTIQQDLLMSGAKALAVAELLTQEHPDLEGWRDTLESVGRDLDAGIDATAHPGIRTAAPAQVPSSTCRSGKDYRLAGAAGDGPCQSCNGLFKHTASCPEARGR